MKSTGEVMGWADNGPLKKSDFGEAFGKAMLAAGITLPSPGKVVLSVRDEDKSLIEPIAQNLIALGFTLMATFGTAAELDKQGIACDLIAKAQEGRPNIIDLIKNRETVFIINTTPLNDVVTGSSAVRIAALQHRICYAATIASATAIVEALKSHNQYRYTPIQVARVSGLLKMREYW